MDTKTQIGALAKTLAGLIHDGEEDAAFRVIKDAFRQSGTFVTRWTPEDMLGYADVSLKEARVIVTSKEFESTMENGELFTDIISAVVHEVML